MMHTRDDCNRWVIQRQGVRTKLLAVIAAGFLGAAWFAPDRALASSVPQPSTSRDTDTVERLLELIRWIMGIMGGTESVPSDPNLAMTMVTAQYYRSGAPQGLTPAEIDEARARVLETMEVLELVKPQLDPKAVSEFEEMLGLLYTDLGGQDLP